VNGEFALHKILGWAVATSCIADSHYCGSLFRGDNITTTLLHGQVAWVIAGGQLVTLLTTGIGAAHFINSRILVK
jgi:hypothetical protein